MRQFGEVDILRVTFDALKKRDWRTPMLLSVQSWATSMRAQAYELAPPA
jgi:hypothetical protein